MGNYVLEKFRADLVRSRGCTVTERASRVIGGYADLTKGGSQASLDYHLVSFPFSLGERR